MKVAQRLLAVLLALVMVFGLLPTSFRPTKAEADECEWNTEDADVLWAEINALEDELYAKRAPATSVVQKVADLVTADEHYVEDSIIWRGDGFFFWETTDGTINGYSSRLRQKLRNSDAVIAETVEDPGEIETVSFANSATRSGSPSSKNVLVVQPYYGIDSSFTTQYKTEGESIAAALGGTCTTLLTTNATVTNIASYMQNAAVTIFDSHGDTDYANGEDYTSRANTSYLCLQSGTGLTTADQKAVSGTFGTYYHAYYAGANGSMKYYCVDGTAITNHMTSSMPNSMVWMAICLGMATSGLNAPFLSHGADVVYGYSQSVTFDGDYAYEEYFWDKMKSGSNVKTTIANMKSSLGYWDPAYSSYSYTNARNNYCAFPIVASSEDTYPGHGNVDTYQTVNSTWTLLGGSSSTTTTAPSAGSTTYTKVTSASDLSAGDTIIIVANDYDYALSTTQNSNNRGQVAITKDGNTVSKVDGLQELMLESGTISGTFAFNTGSGYLYAASNSSNNLKTKTALDENGSFKITISSGVASIVAQGSYTRNTLRYNKNSSLFSCYSAENSQMDVAIYKKAGSSSATATATEQPTATTTTAPATTAPNTTPNPEAEGILIYLDDANTYYGSSGVEALEAILTSSSAESTLISINDSQHTSTTSYDNLRDYALACADRPGDTRLHTGYYRTLYTQYWAPITQGTTGSGAILNREHVIPQSVGGFDTSRPGSDVHHLRPEWADANSSRSNIPFGEVTSGTEYYSNYAGGLYAFLRSSSAVEPADHVKGDVARILMYMYIAYDDDNYNVDPRSSSIFTSGTSTLIDWCMNDPVDVVELNRNNYGQYEQGNRNPFIDCPALSEVIFGSGRYGSTSWYTVTNEVGSYTQTYSGGDPVYTKSSSATYGGYLYVPSYSSRDSFTAVDNYAVPTVVSAGSSFNFTYEVQSSLPGSVAVVYTSTGATLPTSGSGAYYKWDSSTNTVSVYNVDGNITIKYVTGSSSATATPKPTATPTAKPTATPTAKPTATATATTTTAPSTGSTTYTKVTTAPSDWSGEYLIVYEGESRIFDGSLATLDAANNYQSVTIGNSQITTDNKYSFTIAKTSSGYSIRSASGKYIGKTSNTTNGLDAGSSAYENTLSLNDDGTVNVVGSGGAYLRFNAASDEMRFRYYKSSTYTGQKAICLYKASGSGSTATATPTETPAASGEYYVLTDSISGGGEYVIAAQYDGTWYAVSNNPHDTSSLVGGLLPVKMTLSGDILTLNDSSATAADIEWTCYGISTEGYTDYYALKSQDAEYLSYYNPNSGSYEWLSIHTTLTSSGCWQYNYSTKRLVNYSDSSYGISWDTDRSSFDYYTNPLDVYVFEKVTGGTVTPTATPSTGDGTTVFTDIDTLLIYNPLIYYEGSSVVTNEVSTGNMSGQIKTSGVSNARSASTRTPSKTSEFLHLTPAQISDMLGMKHVGAADEVDTRAVTVGSSKKFWIQTDMDDESTYASTTMYARAVGDYCVVWGNSSFTSTSVASNMAAEFDDVIYSADIANFGSARFVEDGEKLNILVYPISTGGVGTILGYFWGVELYSSSDWSSGGYSSYASSYNKDSAIIHINADVCTSTYLQSNVYPTIAHEFQHLINYTSALKNSNNDSMLEETTMNTWLNESMSMQAEELIYPGLVAEEGYISTSYNGSTDISGGQSLYCFDTNNDIGVYGQVFLWSEYMKEQAQNSGVFTKLHNHWRTCSASDLNDGAGILAALTAYNPTAVTNIWNGVSYSSDIISKINSTDNLSATSTSDATSDSVFLSKANLAFQIATYLQETEGIWSLGDACSDADPLLTTATTVSIDGGGRIWVKTADEYSYTVPSDASDYLIYVGFKNGEMVFGPTTAEDYQATTPTCNHANTTTSTVDATCTQAGSTTVTCDDCGEVISTTTIPATGHTEGTAVQENVVAATCETAGSYDSVVYCTVCGAELSRTTKTIPATGHTEGTAVQENVVAATCETAGSYDTVVYCTVCGKEVSRTTTTVPATGHTEVTTVTEATCTQNGQTVVSCSVCGKTLSTTVIPASGHDYQQSGTSTATCVVAGTTTYVCENCGDSYTETGAVNPNNHEHVVADAAVAATCTETGLTEGSHCSDCGKVIVAQQTVPATGHTEGTAVKENVVAATCVVAGSYDTVVYCTVCGKEVSRTTTTVPATGHTEVTTVTEATCTQDGKTVVSCSVCGETLSTTVIPALGHDYAYTSNEDGTHNAVCTHNATHTIMNETCTMQAGTCIYCGYTDPETVVSTLKGDANCDGKVDAADVTLIALYLGGKASLTPQGKLNADMDENGILNLTDRRLIARLITGG